MVTTKATAKVAAVATALAMASSMLSFAPAVHAQTTPATCSITKDLTIGATGAEVICLQTALVAGGYLVMPAGVAMGYFGPLTQSAVAKWQTAKGIAPAAGYFGPISRAAFSPVAGGGSTTTVPGCMPGYVFSPTTGQACGTPSTGGGTTGPLQGGAGSIDSFNEIASISNEKVGEDEEDVEIAGIEIENGEDSDIELAAVRLDFSTQPSNDDLDEFITEVAIMLDGEEIARVDAEDFNDDNNWTRTVSVDGGTIKAGETADLTVAVTGVANVDSDDAGDDWGLDFISVRYVDAQGATITDNTDTDAFTWEVTSFATATGVELKATSDSNTPEGAVSVDDTDDTNGVELLSFMLEADGSDIQIKDLPITVATSSGNTADAVTDIFSAFYLEIDGEEFTESASGSAVAVGSAGATVTFDDIDYTIEDGDKVTVVVKGDVNDTEGSVFVDGDAVTVSYTASNRNVTDAEDETGEELSASDKTGTGNGEEITFYENGINVTLESVDADELTIDGDDNDYVNLTIVFEVEAFGQTAWIPAIATDISSSTTSTGGVPTTAQGVGYHLQYTSAGVASTSVAEVLTSTADEGTNAFEVQEGSTETFTLKVTVSNSAAAVIDTDQFRAILTGINFASTDSATGDEVYTALLQDNFRTGYARVAN